MDRIKNTSEPLNAIKQHRRMWPVATMVVLFAAACCCGPCFYSNHDLFQGDGGPVMLEEGEGAAQ